MNNQKEDIKKAAEVAQFRFGVIAPVVQDLYPCCQQSELLIHMYSVFKAVTTSCSWSYLIRAVYSHKIKPRDCAVLPLRKCFFQISCAVRKGILPILSYSFLR